MQGVRFYSSTRTVYATPHLSRLTSTTRIARPHSALFFRPAPSVGLFLRAFSTQQASGPIARKGPWAPKDKVSKSSAATLLGDKEEVKELDDVDAQSKVEERHPSSQSTCVAYCTAHAFSLADVRRKIEHDPAFPFKIDYTSPKVLKLTPKSIDDSPSSTTTSITTPSTSDSQHPQTIFVFSFGSFVCWGSTIGLDALTQLLESSATDRSDVRHQEEFRYSINSRAITGNSLVSIATKTEELQLRDDTAKFPLSYALAQAVKVDYFEKVLQQNMHRMKQIPEELALHGRVKSLNKREINRQMGNIILLRSKMRLDDTELFARPDIFWELPEHEKTWETLHKYLEVPYRVSIMDKQMEFMNSIYEGLKAEAQARHASTLEQIIIYLIAVEVIFGLVDHAHWFI